MAIPSKAVKSTAKAALKGHWFIASCASIVFMLALTLTFLAGSLLASVLPSVAVSVLFCTLLIFLICPLFLGLLRLFKNLILEYETDPLEIFVYFAAFPAYKRAIRLILELFARFIFYGVIALMSDWTGYGQNIRRNAARKKGISYMILRESHIRLLESL